MAAQPAHLVGVLIGAAAVGYLMLCGAVLALQRDIVFPAPKAGRPPQAPALHVDVPGATSLLWVAPPNDSAPVVVHFHGNAEQVADTQWLGLLMLEAGIGFAAVEYPGYGLALSQAPATEGKIIAAAQLAMSHLTGTMGIDPKRVVLSGQSLGTGVAVALAERGWGTRVLLLTPYTSLPDVGARAFGFLPLRLLMRDQFDSATRAPGIALPVLVIHGDADEVIPADLGKALAGRFPRARFVGVPGAHHNDLWERPEVRAAALGFVHPGSATGR